MVRQAGHERGGIVHRLRCHPDSPARHVLSVDCEWLAAGPDQIILTFVVTGTETLVIPEPTKPARTDELWKTTCFEMFWRPEGAEGYFELNLSPSGRWAAYAFDGYRSGMRDQPMAVDPSIATSVAQDRLVAEIDVDLSTFPDGPVRVSLSTVIEETDGTKSYWALAHPEGPFDFHDPACFVLELPAPR